MTRVIEDIIPKAGETLRDRYVLSDELGRGGFGVVFRARQIGLDEDVAVKVLLPHIVTNDDLAHRFHREVKLAKRLRHPNTIRIIDYAETATGLPFYVMEYIVGRELQDVLHNEHNLSEARSGHICVQVLKALAEAHSHTIVHRDLKPENIFLCEIFGERDFVKVLDFGIAKALAPHMTDRNTKTDVVMGTPNYMSPEQCTGSRIDQRSDIYATGLILAECVSGEVVVDGDNLLQVLGTHASHRPLPFSSAVRQSHLWPVIERACRKDPKERFPTAMQMIEALKALGSLPESKPTPRMWAQTMTREVRAKSAAGRPLTGEEDTIDAIDSGEVRRFVESQWIDDVARPSEQHSVAPRESTEFERPKRRPKRAALVVGGIGFLTLCVALGILALGGGSGPRSSEPIVLAPPEPIESDQGPVQDLGPAVAEAARATQLAMAVGQDEARRTFCDLALVHSQQVVHASLPALHSIRFEGTDGAIVRVGERTLGEIPFELLAPALDGEIQVTAERGGYRRETVRVSLLEATATVSLRRRSGSRPHVADEPTPEPETPATGNPFGGVPLDRTDVD